MSNIKIKCPYCESDKVECSDVLGSEIGIHGGHEHSSYSCYNEECGEYFYVNIVADTTKVEVSKDKWKNYTTIYKK